MLLDSKSGQANSSSEIFLKIGVLKVEIKSYRQQTNF